MTEQQAAGFAAGPMEDARVSAAPWEQAVTTTGRHWGLHLFNGLVMLLIGIGVLVWPGASLLVVSLLFAITLLVNGIVQILRSIADSGAGGGRRVLFGLLGALSLLAGVLCLRSPLQTLAAIALLIGSWWIISGVLTLIGAMSGSTEGSRGWAAVVGVVSVIAGFVVLLQPGISLLALEFTTGIALIVLGAVVMIGAVRDRNRPV
ncbi:MAG TPA: DUF308 domain-containing protein [Actinophytocola sp.]|nr:DUF308 domain-containing protein [Actinophytocola sp.]